jgi:hypothetical protein
MQSGLDDQLEDFKRKRKQMKGAKGDLVDKMEQMNDITAVKKEEVAEIKGALADEKAKRKGKEQDNHDKKMQ